MAIDNTPDRPDGLNEESRLGGDGENVDPWLDEGDIAVHVPADGSSTMIYQDVQREDEEVSSFASGIGDFDDLLSTTPESENMELPFKYAVRQKGRRKNDALIYPELPFSYGVSYKGMQQVDDNERYYDHRVDAYPEREVKFSITEEDPQPIDKDWKVKVDVAGEVRQDELEYAVKWTASAAVESVSGAAQLFTSAKGRFLGPGPSTNWHISGNTVREIDNRSHGSGIIAREFYDWGDYEAEYEFRPIIATGERDDPYAKIMNGNRMYSVPGADDDILGFIFRAPSSHNDFFMFMWEADDRVIDGQRAGNLNGYNMLTGKLSGSYTHAAAEAKWEEHTDQFLARHIDDSFLGQFYSGITLNAARMARVNHWRNERGWKTQHYKLFRVRNGVMTEVGQSSYRGNGKGWVQSWMGANKEKLRSSVKVRCVGNNVRIYTQTGFTGSPNQNNYQLALDYTLPTSHREGSVGLATFSQAVEFDKIRITKWEEISGRVPNEGWDKYDGIGSATISPTGREHVSSDVNRVASGIPGYSTGDFEVTSVTPEVKDSSKGSLQASVNGPVRVTSNNPADAGEEREFTFTKSGTATITPDHLTESTAKVVLSDLESLFAGDIASIQQNNPDIVDIRIDKIEVLEPTDEDPDWKLINGNTLIMWNSEPEIIVTTIDFTRKAFAYEGWIVALNIREHFDGLKWATYEMEVVDETINDEYDEIVMKDQKVYYRTTEWYKGTYPADIKNDGYVTSERDVYVDIPPMPEHYVHPKTGEVMYHGHKYVHFLLVQNVPRGRDVVWMGFSSNFSFDNTKLTKAPLNVIDGRPIIKTDLINDRVRIHCEPNPRWIPWYSGKYIGYGKVNGRRPFFKDGQGKADMIDVPTDVVFIPEHIDKLEGPFIDVDDSRVHYKINYEKNTVDFYSEHQDSYIWYTDWYSDWHRSNKEYTVETGKETIIGDVIMIEPEEDDYYDPAKIIIDGYEVVSTNPFVETWTENIMSDKSGLLGSYYQFPLISHIISESFQVTGNYKEYTQDYKIEQYMVDRGALSIPVQKDRDLRIVSVKINGEDVPQRYQDGWSLAGGEDAVEIRGSALKTGNLIIRYGIGTYQNEFRIAKEIGLGLTVYHKGVAISPSRYEIQTEEDTGLQKLVIDQEILYLNDWIHMQSYISDDQFDPSKKSYLGDFIGTRIDPEIWFNWSNHSPLLDFSSNNFMFRAMSLLSDKVNFKYDIDMEITYPLKEAVDISNFTGDWEQWDAYIHGGSRGPGEWHGPPEPGYDKVINIKNQSDYSGWINPEDQDKSDYVFGFKVECRSDWDDDLYGAAFRWDPETLSGYTFEWDAGGTHVKGMAIYKVKPVDPSKIGGQERLQFERIELDHKPIWWDPDATGSDIPNRPFYTHEVQISVIKNHIKVHINGELMLEAIDEEETYKKGSWGPMTLSSPDTYFWNFWMQEYETATHEEIAEFKKSFSEEVDRPMVVDEPDIQINLSNSLSSIFNEDIQDFLEERELDLEDVQLNFFITRDTSQYPVYFKNSGGGEKLSTSLLESTTYAIVEGMEPPPPPPERYPIENPKEPVLPEYPLPEANPNEYYAVSWNGFVYAPDTGVYEFDVNLSEAIRMWVNNSLIIDAWEENGSRSFTESIFLEGGKWYPIKINYAKGKRDGFIYTRWKMPGKHFRKIDPKYLSSQLGYRIHARIKAETPYPWNPQVHNGYYYHGFKENYLYAKKKEMKVTLKDDKLELNPRPKQGSPIIIRDEERGQLRKVTFYDDDWNLTLENTETFNGNGSDRYYLNYRDIDRETLRVFINSQEVENYSFNEKKSFIRFSEKISMKDEIEVKYKLQDSFLLDINYKAEEDKSLIVFHDWTAYGELTISYEAEELTPFHRAKHIVTNPILNHNHKGFLYLTEKENRKEKKLFINVSPRTVSSTEKEKVTLTAEVLDAYDNPIANKAIKLYRDGQKIYEGKTNLAGEIYFQDAPTAPSNMYRTYKAECGDLENSTLLNFYKKNLRERSYVELKAGKSAIIAGTDDSSVIYITLRDHNWEVLKDKTVQVEYLDTHGQRHILSKRTNSSGKASVEISAIEETTGLIYITATYTGGSEGAKSQLYIKSVRG